MAEHDEQIIRDEQGVPQFMERFTEPRPAFPFTMRVMEDRWDLDGEIPVRTIIRFELVSVNG